MKSPYNTILLLATSLLLYFISVSGCHAQGMAFSNFPKYEVRAVWLTTLGGLDWPHSYATNQASIEWQKKELTDLLDKLKAANFNTVLLQTRIRGTVIYPSAIEPWDACFSGKPSVSPNYDPLAFAIEECHKRGMEIQAWIVCMPLGKWNSFGCQALRSKYSYLVTKDGAEGYMNPESPMTATYIAKICKEITEKYDIDGIHLDYIRYPETWKLKIPAYQARENITHIVKEVHDAVKGVKDWVKISCSPIGKYSDLSRYSSHGWNALNKGCQDAQGWLRDGLMDQLYPMMYFKGNQFYPFVFNWKEKSYGRTVVPGLGIYFLSSSEGNWSIDEIERQMYVVRSVNMGYAFFRNKFLCDNVKGIYTFTKEEFNKYPALIPPMSWASNRKPAAPKSIKVVKSSKFETVTWNSVDNNNGGTLYNVYASRTYPVDVDDVRNLVAQRSRTNQLTLRQSSGNIFYAVTAVDRYGNESNAVQLPDKRVITPSNTFIKNDGKRMTLPDKGSELDADLILIKSLTGTTVATRPYKGTYANISKIPDGCYRVYSLGKKNISHRLGFLIIKR
ncbi:MAG: family 10 glycosylhydrolase [Prevotella sp.]|nr:family 10 glycosylhydrolase [Prevotella sp.]